ncbi:phage capsid protein [Rhizobacter sp. Root1221]|uniref:phage capsid protein n=1 Tax=Rhizobacter sp. Root1221 TaxID=1736433 RepID=UPI0006F32DD3|nr:phage capsid protein [Rhizobacter sp. Root1221]KQV99972.1 hypothetical protein ASC87_19925 [Rhizobacter sp. Root1221]
MAFGDTNTATIAFGTGASGSDDRALFLKQFGGEVLTALTASTVMQGKTREKTIGAGKSWQFPKTGTSVAEYITRGQELLGNAFATDEVTVTVDAPLVASHALWDMDVLMSHFDVRAPMVTDMGQALARTFDQNVMRSLILAARTAATGTLRLGGNRIVNAGLTGVAGTDGIVWMNKIREAKLALQAKNVPVGTTLYMVVNPTVFDAIKYAQINGQYVNLSSMIQLASVGVGSAVTEAIRFEGVTIFTSNLLPSINETAVTSVFSKYRADYSNTTGILWAPDAVATLSLLGVTAEATRDVRRQEDFMLAKRINGHGTLREELAVEFATA